MYLQDLIFTLGKFWAERGCVIEQPVDVEVGAGTFHPATFLRVLGPEPWNAAFAQFCRRPSDGRYGENPNRAGAYYQYQVGLKPSPLNVQDLYLDSLRAIGLDPKVHDIRFVEDDWESPTLGAWGLGWEVWCDGMEVTQFTYFQQAGGIDLMPVTAELTYGVERLAMYLQNVASMFDLKWDRNVTYGQLRKPWEVEYSTYHFEELDPKIAFELFDTYERECNRLLARGLTLPAYEMCRLKSSHQFNSLDARGADQRHRAPALHRPASARHGACVRACVRPVAREARLSVVAERSRRAAARRPAFDGAIEAGVNAAALAAARKSWCRTVPGAGACRLACCSRSVARRSRRRCSARALVDLPRGTLAKKLDATPASRTARSPAYGTPRRLAVIVDAQSPIARPSSTKLRRRAAGVGGGRARWLADESRPRLRGEEWRRAGRDAPEARGRRQERA